MKLNAISAASNLRSNRHVSFNGQWKTRSIYNGADYHVYNKKEYIPDEGETPRQIAFAWLKETGLLPIDWVKEVNPFNQIKNHNCGPERETEYTIKGLKYMPLGIIKESVKIKMERNQALNRDYTDELIDLANLSLTEGNKEEAKYYERQIIEQYKKQSSSKVKMGFKYLMEDYKENWGKSVWADDSYCGGKRLDMDSDELIKLSGYTK